MALVTVVMKLFIFVQCQAMRVNQRDYPDDRPRSVLARERRVHDCLNSVLQILIIAGIICVTDFILRCGIGEGSLKAEVRNLTDAINRINFKLTKGLANLRRQFEKDLKSKEISLRKSIFNDMKEYMIRHMNETTKKITEAIQLYDADKTGMADYALRTLGGSAEVIGDTEPLGDEAAGLVQDPNTVQCIISPSIAAGECWGFKGSKGSALIHLVGKVYITAVSLEHIPAVLSPTGEISNAPKEFSIWGVKCEYDEEKILLGKFEYNKTGSRIQHFLIKESSRSFSRIELRIHSNHGNSVYTCIYRLRVHGIPNLSKFCNES